MRLENLYQNFANISSEAQSRYISEYRAKRAEDMAKTPTWPKPTKTKAKAKASQLTEEEKTIMNLLGLKKKEVIALRTLSTN